MARVTIEDCIEKIPNRFDLVLVATGRTKSLAAGVSPTLNREGDKNTVLALREIEADTIDLNLIRDGIISSMQRYAKPQEAVIDAQEIKEVEAEIMGDTLYADTEFVESDAFQVVEDINDA